MECDSTYNLTILSRTRPELIKKDLFLKFSENDAGIAWEYAFSPEMAKKNNVELDYSSVEYEILHDNISINDILSDNDEIIFRIRTPFEFGLKLSSVIRQSLGLSANQLNQLIEKKAIFTYKDCLIKKYKVKNGDIVLINKELLQRIYRDRMTL